jgi:hypothetical protein
MSITKYIIDLIGCYQQRGWADSPQQINNGLCEEFAEEVVRLIPNAKAIWIEDTFPIDASHKVVSYKGRYYDAELPEGSSLISDLVR